MRVSMNFEVVSKYPELRVAFVIAPNIADYRTDMERADAEQTIVKAVNETYCTLDEAESQYLNPLYAQFYKSMGLRPKSVSTPLAPVSRVIKQQVYRSIHHAVDISLMVEFTTLISIHVYDAAKLVGDLEYRLAQGDESLETFHGETKIAKPGELILVDESGLVHSAYYGNDRRKAVDKETTLFLYRIMAVPGTHEEDLSRAIRRICELSESETNIVLGGPCVSGSIN